jgi:hypothetical protein
VIPLNARIFHYSHARNPHRQRKRQIEFEKGWIPNEVVEKKYAVKKNEAYDYSNIDYLGLFAGAHPGVMHERIGNQDWEFLYSPSVNNMKPKEKILRFLERLTGRQFFIYKNYKIVRL